MLLQNVWVDIINIAKIMSHLEYSEVLYMFHNIRHTPVTGQHAPGFLKLLLCRHLYVCVSAPKAINS